MNLFLLYAFEQADVLVSRLAKERDLEGIDVSNIVQGGRRARRTAAAAAPINYAAIDQSESSGDDDNDENSGNSSSEDDASSEAEQIDNGEGQLSGVCDNKNALQSSS